MTSSSEGSTETMALSPPSVIHGVPASSTITPCGAEPAPSGMCRVSPVAGSRWPSAPTFCAVYHTPPSAAGATSCGCVPAGTGYDSIVHAVGAAVEVVVVGGGASVFVGTNVVVVGSGAVVTGTVESTAGDPVLAVVASPEQAPSATAATRRSARRRAGRVGIIEGYVGDVQPVR